MGACEMPDAHTFPTLQNRCVVAQVTKKSSHEKFPSTSKYSDRSRAADASHTVSLDTEFRCISNPDEVVAPEDRVKAYKVLLFCWSHSLISSGASSRVCSGC